MTIIIITLILFFILICRQENSKEGYKKQRRKGIRSGWRRRGGAAKAISMHGTRWNKYKACERDNVFEYLDDDF